jgi:hypothetical protein
MYSGLLTRCVYRRDPEKWSDVFPCLGGRRAFCVFDSQPHSDDHNERGHRQHTDSLAAGVAAADPHPQPVPLADFTSASSAQQALVPDGAAPPQQVCGVSPCASDVWAAPRFVVFD